MTKKEREENEECLRTQGEIAMRRKLAELTDLEYAGLIGDAILDDVLEDVRQSSDFQTTGRWSYDDIDLAIGRVLCKKLGLMDGSGKSLDERIENLKGCLFDRDQIRRIRQIAADSEHVLDLEDGKCTRKQEKRYAAE